MLIAGWVKIPVLENKQNQLKLARSLSLSSLSFWKGLSPFYHQCYFALVLAAFNSDVKGQMTLDLTHSPLF